MKIENLSKKQMEEICNEMKEKFSNNDRLMCGHCELNDSPYCVYHVIQNLDSDIEQIKQVEHLYDLPLGFFEDLYRSMKIYQKNKDRELNTNPSSIYIKVQDGDFYKIFEVVEQIGKNYKVNGQEDLISEDLVVDKAKEFWKLCDVIKFKTKDNENHFLTVSKYTLEQIFQYFGGNNIILDTVRYGVETQDSIKWVAKIENNQVCWI